MRLSRRCVLCATTIACLVLAGCSDLARDSVVQSRSAADEAAIRDFAEQYARSFMSQDAGSVVDLMTEDFVALTPDKPPVVGKAAVQKEVERDLKEMEVVSLRFQPEEIVTKGDWAWSWGVSEAHVKPKGDGESEHIRGMYLWILRRNPDGSWRIARDCAHGG